MSDIDKARKAMERAFMLMENHSIEPTPGNVMAWYAYAGQFEPSWNRKLDQILASKKDLPRDKWEEQICRFVLGMLECEQLFQGVNGLYSAVRTALNHLAEAEGATSEFGQRLKATADRLGDAKSLDDARATIGEVVTLTHQMVDRQQVLAANLKETTEEVVLLRNRLEEVHRQAVTDELTDLGNRRYFDARLRELTEEAAQTGSPLTLTLIDIDHFKKFNDRHGHQTGDNVLKLVANIIRSAVRESDVAARIGGEEFALVLYRTPLEEATKLAERIRKTLHSRELVKRGANESLGRITVSGGVAAYAAGLSVEELFERADQALYRAKGEGRNRTIVADGA